MRARAEAETIPMAAPPHGGYMIPTTDDTFSVTPARGEPLVSVVTPVYNEEQYLAECIESVLSQTYTNWEYTIVDNLSTDRSFEIASSYADRDPRIHVRRNGEFVSAVNNHNIAFRSISRHSKYCKVIDGDDWMFSTCLERLVDFAEAHPTVAVVGSYRLSGSKLDSDGPPYPETIIPGREVCRKFLLGGPYLPALANCLLYRADFVRAHDPFFPSQQRHADSEACLNLLEFGDLGFVHEILTFNRVRDQSETSYVKLNNLYVFQMLDFLQKYGPRYLTNQECERRFGEQLRLYYEYLGSQIHERRGAEFWDLHRKLMASIGLKLCRTRILANGAFYLAEAAIRRVRRRL